MIKEEKAVLSLDRTEDTKKSHVVHFMTFFESRSFLLKFLYKVDTVQGAKMKTDKDQCIIDEYSSEKAFAAIASENL